MLLLTGGAGFIGSCFLWKLNQEGITDVIISDEFTADKWRNLVGKRFRDFIPKEALLARLFRGELAHIDAIVHLGARTDTTEENFAALIQDNYEFSKALALYAVEHQIRFLYASSAATYGAGEHGFQECQLWNLRPLNAYGFSKHLFDCWAATEGILEHAVGIKLFNVYGPNEYHKGRMASLVWQGFQQIRKTGCIRLFKSTDPQYNDGEQKRDFVYVKDVVEVLWKLLCHRNLTGLYNVGTGYARSWNELAHALFAVLNRPVQIQYVDMPKELQSQYQNFTQADITKLQSGAAAHTFVSLEEGIQEYVSGHLLSGRLYL
ncbi:MAG: ADP-glyceromanno-heptose 6-epimerase [Candidatus Kapabacteria bacterium]|nr:ADP-glyceromanno-heptose 6-epimerase [Candidatus Kapabacteria bacterium]MDW7996944.1 ADP-glyceromanno-heptose 6-epimerase [Bacteroidota bacterium]MDW8224853.1 ADP-glyceromanno-heptose 6-epimerase [Bacteroidota bacterium]